MKEIIPKYKEDRYSEMVRNTSFNPFNITTDPSLNCNLTFGDLTDVFEKEIIDHMSSLHGIVPTNQIINGYIFNLIESYYKNAGYVPKAAMDIIIEQVFDALQRTPYCIYKDIDQFKYNIYWGFTHK
jgi:hypothetical protein